MVMTALREGASGGILKYFLLGLLCMAAGGLVFMDIGGFFRGGVTSTDAAKVGKQTIGINQFDRVARTSLRRLGMTPEQAYQAGYITELLNGEIRGSLLQQKASDVGIRVGTPQVAENVQKLLQPMAQPGQSPQDVLQQLLISQGISEGELINAIGREMTVNLLGNAVQSGFLDVSPSMALDLARYENEQRSIEFLAFKDKDFADVEEPSEEKLLEFYEGTKEAYAIPETRKSQIILIETDALKDSLEISEEEIQETYEQNISAYSEPEKRKIEQVILSDADQAAEIHKQVQAGTKLKDAVQAVTGNTTDYIPAKSIGKEELLEEIREDVFTAPAKDVIGPVETGLGHHILVVQKIVEAQTTPLSEVKKDIKEELAETRLLDAQYDLASSVDDFLAAGEPIETLKEELNVKIQDMPFTNSFGLGPDGKATFTAPFGPDAQTLVTNLFELGEGEASPVIELADGRMAALVVTEIQDKSYKPFEDLKADLKKRWMKDTRRVQNKMHVLEVLSNARNEKTPLKDVAKNQKKQIQTAASLKRAGEAKAPLTSLAIKTIFEAPNDELFVLDLKDGTAIAKIQKLSLTDKPNDESFKAAENTLLQSLQNEAYTIYVQGLQNKYGVKVNEKLLNAVYGTQTEQ